MSTETCKLCGEEATPWYHINGHICQDCYSISIEKNKSHWISVKDDLPQINELILINISHENEQRFEISYLSVNRKFTIGYSGETSWDESVTHWMPLPEPPMD